MLLDAGGRTYATEFESYYKFVGLTVALNNGDIDVIIAPLARKDRSNFAWPQPAKTLYSSA